MTRQRSHPRPSPLGRDQVTVATPASAASAQEETPGPDRGVATSVLRMDQTAREVAVPLTGQTWVCPRCLREIPPDRVLVLGKPPEYEHLLNTVHRCPFCRFVFSYRSRAVVVRA